MAQRNGFPPVPPRRCPGRLMTTPRRPKRFLFSCWLDAASMAGVSLDLAHASLDKSTENESHKNGVDLRLSLNHH